jgi:hypothetical protein
MHGPGARRESHQNTSAWRASRVCKDEGNPCAASKHKPCARLEEGGGGQGGRGVRRKRREDNARRERERRERASSGNRGGVGKTVIDEVGGRSRSVVQTHICTRACAGAPVSSFQAHVCLRHTPLPQRLEHSGHAPLRNGDPRARQQTGR